MAASSTPRYPDDIGVVAVTATLQDGKIKTRSPVQVWDI
jgi:hypothetical protein